MPFTPTETLPTPTLPPAVYTPTVLAGMVYGSDALDHLSTFLKDPLIPPGPILLMTGTHLSRTTLVTRVEEIIGKRLSGVFTGISQHSPIAGIQNALKEVERTGAKAIVTLGGGSVIDAAKAVSYFHHEAHGEFLPQIAIPTTLSAAECTSGAGFTNAEGRKTGCWDPLLAPRFIVYDPGMTIATPERLWLSTGLRALDHAIEGLYRPLTPAPTQALALAAIPALFTYLPLSKAHPSNLDYRSKLLVAAWESLGSASVMSAYGPSHALGHNLGAAYSIPHGITSCITLSSTIKLLARSSLLSQPEQHRLWQALSSLPPAVASLLGYGQLLSTQHRAKRAPPPSVTMSNRVYYDVANPRMLSEEEIMRMTPAECIAAGSQIDANLVGVLQEIDESLSESNEIINQRILPAVQQYGENSQKIWESVKFWKSFYEAAANTKLNDPDAESDSNQSDSTIIHDGHGQRHGHGEGDALGGGGGTPGSNLGDQSLAFSLASSDASDASGSSSGTPRPFPVLPKWSDDIGPFAALQKDLDQFGINVSASSNASLVAQTQREMAQLRKEHHLDSIDHHNPNLNDSPSAVPVPEFETLRGFDAYLDPSKGKGRAFDFAAGPDGSPVPRLKAGADKHHPMLLQKLLQKNHAAAGSTSPLPPPPSFLTSSTSNPKGKGKAVFPDGVSTNWNGIADLSLGTPMSAFASPSKRRADQSELSPPSGIMSFSFSPAAPSFSRTPAKVAAQRMALDVYAMQDSPGMPSPPSAIKNYASRAYDFLPPPLPNPSPTPPLSSHRGGEGSRRGFEEEDDDDNSFDLPDTRGAGSLADYGGGTTARIDDLLAEHSFAKIVDDDDDDHRRRRGQLDTSDEDPDPDGDFAPTGLSLSPSAEIDDGGLGDESYLLEQQQGGRGRVMMGEGPEDTLFGIGRGHPSQNSSKAPFDEDEDGSFALHGGGSGGASGFRIRGNVEETLHGGLLLDSEPFEASPLAGRHHGR
ncbi:hypothetical protein RQP46_008513 [Phenoliferia psychrophenolica]